MAVYPLAAHVKSGIGVPGEQLGRRRDAAGSFFNMLPLIVGTYHDTQQQRLGVTHMNLTPMEIEKLTTWSADALREMRRRGFLSNYGEETEGGRWRYSLRDLVAFDIASRLWQRTGEGFMLQTCFALAWTNAPHVIDLIRGKAAPACVAVLNQSRPFPSKEVDLRYGGSEVVTLSGIAELAERDFDDAHIINLNRIAETTSLKVKAYVIEA